MRVIYHEDTEWVKKSELDKLRRQVSIYEKALEFYANSGHYKSREPKGIHCELGGMARAALEEGRK